MAKKTAASKKGHGKRRMRVAAPGDGAPDGEDEVQEEETTVYRFRLMPGCGDHTENGVRYSAGEVIETPHDLAAMFRNKFKRLGGPTTLAPAGEDTYPLDNDAVLDKPKVLQKAAKGADAGPARSQSTSKNSKTVVSGDGVHAVAKTTEDFDDGTQFGEDVTEEFEGAEAAGAKVFYDADEKKFTVTEADDVSEPMRGGQFASRKATREFVAGLSGGETAE